jgi:hypothetical protein
MSFSAACKAHVDLICSIRDKSPGYRPDEFFPSRQVQKQRRAAPTQRVPRRPDGAHSLYSMQKKNEIPSLDSCSPTHRAMRLRDGWGTQFWYNK